MNLIAYILVGISILTALAIANVLFNLEHFKANYHNPYRPMESFSLVRVLWLKVVILVGCLAIADWIKPGLIF